MRITRFKLFGNPETRKSVVRHKFDIVNEEKLGKQKKIVHSPPDRHVQPVDNETMLARQKCPEQNVDSIQHMLLDEQFTYIKHLYENVDENTDIIIEKYPLEYIQFFNVAYLIEGYLTPFTFGRLNQKIEDLTQFKIKHEKFEYNDVYIVLDKKVTDSEPITKFKGQDNVYRNVQNQMESFLSSQKRVRHIMANGYHAQSNMEEALEKLLTDENLQKNLGTAVETYGNW